MKPSSIRPVVRRLFALAGLLAATLASAATPTKSFNVPAGDAEKTLRQFSAQSGVQVIFPTQAIRGVTTNAVQGQLTTDDALDALLAGTPLVAVRDTTSGTLTIRREASIPDAEKNGASRPAEAEAAQTTADGKVKLQEFEVRSSRVDGLVNKGIIPTSEDSPIYFDVIGRDEIERMGATNIEEVLRNTNQITTYSTANQEASVTQIVGPGSLASNIRMRGLDALQTTVLINGRRIARASFPNLVGNASGDLSRIPVAAIERIEIMPMSGSAMYGGGAIGGVINVILRKNYSGRELTTKIGTSTEGGGTEFSVNYLHGFSMNDGRTSGTLSINYKDRGPLSFYDRQNLLNRAVQRLPIETQIRNFTQMPGIIRLNSSTGDLGIPGAPGIRYAAVPAGLSPAEANALTPGSFTATAGEFTPSFERYKSNYIYTPSEALSVNFTGEHQFNDLLTAYGEFSFNTNRQEIENTKFFGSGSSYSMSATHPFNPFRTGVTPGFAGRAVTLNVLMTDARTNITDMRRDSYRAVAGVKGKIGERWEWTLDGTSEVTEIVADSQVGGDNINLATFFSTSPAIAAPLSERWDIYNLLADHNAFPVDGSVNENYFNSVAQQRYWQYASNLIGRVSGDLYDWRAGTIRTSVGAEAYWWQYEGKRPAQTPQTLIDLLGASNAPRSIEYMKQGRRTDSLFAEVTVPVLSKKWSPVPVDSLDINLSGRHESTDDSKASRTFAAAAKLAVTRDLALRASYTEGFFPPEQDTLHLEDYRFSTSFTSQRTVIDPRRGNVAHTYVVTTTSGPNPDLRPETSTSENYGIIFTPRFIPGLRINLDYWDIEKVDAIRTPTAAQLLQNEAFFGDRVIRGPNLAGDDPSWAGPVTSFDTRFINVASLKTDGYDLQVNYNLRTTPLGQFTLSSNATYTDKLKTVITPNSAPTDTIETREGALKWRGRASVFWERDVWRAGVTARYTHSYVTETTAPSPQFPTASGLDGERISSEVVWDLQLGYRIAYNTDARGWRRLAAGTDWTIGALNVFNRMPPWYSSGFYSRFSDPRMRYVYLQVKKTL